MPSPGDMMVVSEACLLLIVFVLQVGTSMALDKVHPSYHISEHNSSHHDPHRHRHHKHRPIIEDAQNPETLSPAESIQIFWVNSTTDSISINWTLVPSYNLSGYVHSCLVEYITTGGRFTSHPLSGQTREYTIGGLSSGMIYTVCVYMTEIYGVANFSSKIHSQCLRINTIDYIRKDSVLIGMLSVGYYAFMTLLGYTQWKRKVWSIERKMKGRTKDVDSNIDSTNCVMRWRDLAERDSLMQVSPGCSIETEYR